MAVSASVAIVGNAIVNQPVTVVVTLSNTGGSAVNVVSVQPVLRPGSHSSIISPIFVPVNQAIAETNGFQNTIQLPATTGTAYATFQVICPGPAVQTGQRQQGGPAYQVGADCALDDGTVFSAPLIPLPFAGVQFGAPELNPNAPSGSVGGELQFNSGQNSALVF